MIHWVNADDCIDIEARLYDYLLLAGGEDKDFSERMNPNSLIVKQAKAEKILEKAKPCESCEFFREGYFWRDLKAKDRVFNRTVGL